MVAILNADKERLESNTKIIKTLFHVKDELCFCVCVHMRIHAYTHPSDRMVNGQGALKQGKETREVDSSCLSYLPEG